MLTKTKLDKMFDERFVRKQDILDATPEKPLIIGSTPPIDEIKQFIYTAIDSVVREVVGEKKEQVDEWDIKGAIENKYIDKQLTKYKEMGFGEKNK